MIKLIYKLLNIPDERCMLRAYEDEQTHTHQLLWGQQHVFLISWEVLLQFCSPQLLI